MIYIQRKNGVSKLNKWWTETRSTFEGVPVITYQWPKDRFCALANADGSRTLWVTTFSLKCAGSILSAEIKSCIQACTDLNKKPPHSVHVFKIDGFGEDLVGIAVACQEMVPQTDFFTEDYLQDQKRAESRKSK